MMAFARCGKPLGFRFHRAFKGSVLSTKEVDQKAGFLYRSKKIMADCLHQADLKSLNSESEMSHPCAW